MLVMRQVKGGTACFMSYRTKQSLEDNIMKKIFTMVIAVRSMTLSYAQTAEEIEQSANRVAELLKLEVPTQTNLEAVDQLTASVDDATKQVAANSQKMQDYYYRMIGTPKGEVTTVPTLEEWQALGSDIKAEKELIDVLPGKSEKAAASIVELKDKATANPLKAAKVLKEVKKATEALNYSKKAIPMLGEEMAAQTKFVTSVIASMASGQ